MRWKRMISSLVMALGMAGALVVVSCGENPGEPVRENELDRFNPVTGGIGEASLSIADGSEFTADQNVSLAVTATNATQMMVSNRSDFAGATWTDYATSYEGWQLEPGDGAKTVHVRFANETVSGVQPVSDEITLDETPPDLSGLTITPADGAIDATDRELTWSGATDATSGITSYRVLLDATDPPTTEIYAGSETSCPTGVLQPETTYHWHLIAIDAVGNESTSDVFSFTTDPTPIGFVTIPSGQFEMGSPDTEPGHQSDEEPQHMVTLNGSYWMQSTEVTNAQYAELAQWALDHDPPLVTATTGSLRDALGAETEELLDLNDSDYEISYSGGTFTVDAGQEDHPVKEVTWYGAAAYCDWLSLREGLPRAYDHDTWQCNGHDPYSAQGYRLPTEAEWERACRAGTTTPFHTGDCLDAGTEANYNGNHPYNDCPDGSYEGWTVPVGSYPANEWGLHDMHGNLYEWCNDWYTSYGGDETDPAGPSGPEAYRVLRGGSWNNAAQTAAPRIGSATTPTTASTTSASGPRGRPTDGAPRHQRPWPLDPWPLVWSEPRWRADAGGGEAGRPGRTPQG